MITKTLVADRGFESDGGMTNYVAAWCQCSGLLSAWLTRTEYVGYPCDFAVNLLFELAGFGSGSDASGVSVEELVEPHFGGEVEELAWCHRWSPFPSITPRC